MKKIILTSLIILSAVFCQAQMYIGGSIGVGYQKQSEDLKLTKTEDISILAFTFEPNLGYMFNDRVGIGIDFGIGFGNGKQGDFTTNVMLWNVNPYFRWIAIDIADLKIYADTKFSIGGEQDKEELNGMKRDRNKIQNFGVNFIPGILYEINEHFSLTAQLNVLGLGYNMSKTTFYNEEGYTDEDTRTIQDFGFAFNGKTDLNIGFIYIF